VKERMHRPIGSENDTANGLHWYAVRSRSSPTSVRIRREGLALLTFLARRATAAFVFLTTLSGPRARNNSKEAAFRPYHKNAMPVADGLFANDSEQWILHR